MHFIHTDTLLSSTILNCPNKHILLSFREINSLPPLVICKASVFSLWMCSSIYHQNWECRSTQSCLQRSALKLLSLTRLPAGITRISLTILITSFSAPLNDLSYVTTDCKSVSDCSLLIWWTVCCFWRGLLKSAQHPWLPPTAEAVGRSQQSLISATYWIPSVEICYWWLLQYGRSLGSISFNSNHALLLDVLVHFLQLQINFLAWDISVRDDT